MAMVPAGVAAAVAKAQAAAAAISASTALVPAAPDFLPAAAFSGAKPNMVFKVGDKGLGYYKDGARVEEASSTQLTLFMGKVEDKYDDNAAKMLMVRLTISGHKFLNLNPFYVLEIKPEHTIEELKASYKKMECLLNPAYNTDTRVSYVKSFVEKCYTVLTDPHKRDRYLETCIEARDRVEYERRKKNKERAKNFEAEFPISGPEFEGDVTKTIFKLMAELDERMARTDAAAEKTKDEREEKKVMIETKRKEQEVWEGNREDRVSGWRQFSKKKKRKAGASLGKYKLPDLKTEARRADQIETVVEGADNARGSMGQNNKYKRQWR